MVTRLLAILLQWSNSHRTTRVRVMSGIFVPKDRFTDGKFVYPHANPKLTAELRNIENKLLSLEQLIFSLCETTAPEKLTNRSISLNYNFHRSYRLIQMNYKGGLF